MQANSTSKNTTSKSFRTIERKLYPNQWQITRLEEYLSISCQIYNRALEQRIKAYKRRNESISLYDQQMLLTKQRARIEAIRSVPLHFERDALRRLDKAFKAFFRRCKARVKSKGFPRFRSQRRFNSLEYQDPRYYFRAKTVFVPGIGEIDSRGQTVTAKQKLLRIVRRVDAWYAQIVVECENRPLAEPKNSVGIDVGINSFTTLSTGEKVDNPRFQRKSQPERARLQRNVTRKVDGSKNRYKAIVELRRHDQRVASRRKDFAHHESRKIVNRFDLIGFEKLNIALLASGKLAKSVSDVAWGMFLFFIVYKAAYAGKLAVPVEARGTSQECPHCGQVKKKNLKERIHNCECGLVLDRDHASALVVEARAVAVAAASNLRRDRPLPDCARDPACLPNETGSHFIATR
jgi:putative transposase